MYNSVKPLIRKIGFADMAWTACILYIKYVLKHIYSTMCVPVLKSRFKFNTEKGIQMGERIRFSGNYSDLSTDKGFQFEFNCSRCGTTYRTRF